MARLAVRPGDIAGKQTALKKKIDRLPEVTSNSALSELTNTFKHRRATHRE